MSDTLGGVGEAGVLGRIFPRLPAAASALVGPGDDAAVIAAPDGRFVVTTDTMVHGPDFRLAWSTPFELGWKAAATNLSDVAAMGAVPSALVVAIVAPADTPVATLEGIADGFREACAALAPGCGVVGGDLSVSPTLTIAVTAFGDLGGRPPVLRSGARPGDVVAVSGELAGATRGLALLFAEGVDAAGLPDAGRVPALRTAHAADLAAQLAPRPPLADGVRAAEAGATAMLDVSDGLTIDARRLAVASGVVLDLDSAAVGSPEALHGAEAHALLATFPAALVAAGEHGEHGQPGQPGQPGLPGGFRVIGRVRDAEGAAAGVRIDGREVDGRGGWDPYADWDGAADASSGSAGRSQ